MAVLLTAVFVATPGQDHRVLAAELGVIGIVMSVGAVLGGVRQDHGRGRRWTTYTVLLILVPAVSLVVAAASLWLQAGGGLYWVTVAVATGFTAATVNAWVLVVEIKR